MSETPKEAARRLFGSKIALGYVPVALHTYVNADGQQIFYRARMEHPDGDAAPDGRKYIRPFHLNGSGYKLGEPDYPNGKKPIYNLDRIAANPDAEVHVVEGEKAADALGKLDAIATTSGGADSAGRVDWSPLAGRTCILWPDSDEAGREYMAQVAAILEALACKLSVIDIDAMGLPAKGDAYDWLASRPEASLGDLLALPRVDAHRVQESAPTAHSGLPDVALIRGDTVTPRPIRWLWRGWLAAGKFHVLGGQPGTGKTTIALDIAATVSSGGRWPDGSQAEAGNVLIWSGEDDAADVLVPRLQAMGADMSRIYFVGTVRRGVDAIAFDPATDLPALERKAEGIGGVRLLIVDPVVSAVAGDSHKNAETRRSLQPLVNLAQRLDCAALGITHFSKGTGGREPIERITGSLAFGALARVVLVAFKQPEDRAEGAPARMLVRAKSNISPDDGGFGYDLIHEDLHGFPGVGSSRVEWGAPVDGTARELLAKAEEVDEEGGGANAREFLRYTLSYGAVPASEVFRDGEAHGYSKRQLQRAADKLGVRRDKSAFKGGWEWALPKMPTGPEDTEDAEQNGLAPSAPSAEANDYRRVRG